MAILLKYSLPVLLDHHSGGTYFVKTASTLVILTGIPDESSSMKLTRFAINTPRRYARTAGSEFVDISSAS